MPMLGTNIWMAKYWREYRRARKMAMNRTEAKRFAKFETQMWYHIMQTSKGVTKHREILPKEKPWKVGEC